MDLAYLNKHYYGQPVSNEILIGLVQSLFFLGLMIGALLANKISDNYGRITTNLYTEWFSIVIYTLYFFGVQCWPVLLVGRLGSGLANGIFIVLSSKIINET